MIKKKEDKFKITRIGLVLVLCAIFSLCVFMQTELGIMVAIGLWIFFGVCMCILNEE